MKLAINSTGALISFVVSIIFFVTKFQQVWSILVFLPLIIFMFHRIKKHYGDVGEQLRILNDAPALKIEGNVMIVPIAGMTKVVENSIAYAKSLSPKQIIAVYVAFDKEQEKEFEEKWKVLHPDVRLVTLYSHYRSIITPLTKFIGTVEHKASESNYQVTVVIPQFIPKKGWHNILHNQSGLMIRSVLLYRRKVVIATVPYHLEK